MLYILCPILLERRRSDKIKEKRMKEERRGKYGKNKYGKICENCV